jgi:hypothetical protein
MSTFCGSDGVSIPVVNPDQWSQTFPPADESTKKSILPPAMPDMSNGIAAESWVVSYVKQLEDTNRIPRPTQTLDNLQSNMYGAPQDVDPLASFVQKDNEVQNNLKTEYCFYEKRYLSVLDAFLTSVGDASLNGNNASTVDTRLNQVISINQKLILLSQIINQISISRYNSAQKYQTDINSLNETLKGKQLKLQEQRNVLLKENASLDVNKRMVEYTSEKNRANNNLLAIYAALNVVAIAMVFYIAKT